MLIIVGLGNPGITYKNTYHNMGFWCVDALAKRLGVDFVKRQCKAKVAVAKSGGETVILAKPQTYMNLSGDSVAALAHFYKVEPSDLVIIYDDADLEKGKLRIRASGSGGSHNGMKDIVAKLGMGMPRIRLGIERPSDRTLMEYVLSKIDKQSQQLLASSVDKAVEALEFYIRDRNIEHVMSRFNTNAE